MANSILLGDCDHPHKLPFVNNKVSPVIWWTRGPARNYDEAVLHGKQMAKFYMHFIKNGMVDYNGGYLQLIANDMHKIGEPDIQTGHFVGFFSEIEMKIVQGGYYE